MFKPPRMFFSQFAGTVKRLSFERNIPTLDPTTKEERTNFQPLPGMPVLCDVQPHDPSKPFTTLLQETFGRVYDIMVDGKPDLRHNDRVTIDGAECIVVSLSPWGDHLELVAASRQPGFA